MIIVISDANEFFWRYDHPMFEPYKDAMLVVCLYGKPVTDKYECFVCPPFSSWLGQDSYDYQSAIFRNLLSVADDLVRKFRYHEDIIFLTENSPVTLYPFLAAKDRDEYNSLHLCTIRPLRFEAGKRRSAHDRFLSDLSRVSSLLYMNLNVFLDELPPKAMMDVLFDTVENSCADLLPRILYQIQERKWSRGFFDTYSKSYLPLDDGANMVEEAMKNQEIDPEKIRAYRMLCTLGICVAEEYPNSEEYTLKEIEKYVPRLDGKAVCNYLRKLRRSLAEANHIDFETEECPVVGPCAGTCEKCDQESAYLREEMKKIPTEQRVYPGEVLEKWEGLA